MMNAHHAKTCRISMDGLTATEKTVFLGMTRLSDRNGINFEFSTTPGTADVVILDGADQSSINLAQFNERIAQRTIWIDPPELLHAIRRVSRPLRWANLLLMVERMVGASPGKSSPAPSKPAGDMTVDQLCVLSESILRAHMGIAAEFVIDDIRNEMGAERAEGNEQRISDLFLTCIRKHLPKSADTEKLVQQVSEAIAQG